MNERQLLDAAGAGDAATVRKLLTAGADVDAVDENGRTPLMLAAWLGHEAVAREVLEFGPNLAPRASDGWRALTYASANTYAAKDGGRTRILDLLMDAGDAPEPGDGDWKALHYAAEWGNLSALGRLVNGGLHPDVRDPEGRTALMRAARKSKADCVLALLDLGADSNIADADGETALMFASRKANVDQVQGLLTHGARTDLRNARGETALDIAKGARKSKIAAMLERG